MVPLIRCMNPNVQSYVSTYVADSVKTIDGTYIVHDGYYRKEDTKLYTRTVLGCDALVFDESWEVGDTTTWLDYRVFNEEIVECYTVYETFSMVASVW